MRTVASVLGAFFVFALLGVSGVIGCASPPPPAPVAQGEAEAWMRKASDEAKRGRWPEALAMLEEAEKSAPESPEVKRAVGAVLLRLGRIAEAEARPGKESSSFLSRSPCGTSSRRRSA